MGYSINANFTGHISDSISNELSRLKGHLRKISEPFVGFGISLDDPVDEEDNKAALLGISNRNEGVLLIYINYSTFGGSVDMASGYAVLNGRVLSGSSMEVEDDNDQIVLKSLLKYLCVNLENTKFKPFHRGFFHNT